MEFASCFVDPGRGCSDAPLPLPPVKPQPLSVLCCQRQHVGLDLMASHIVCSICLRRAFISFGLMFNKTPGREKTENLKENLLEE